MDAKHRLQQLMKTSIEELILASIILLNIFDAIEMLPSDLDYVKKIISWSALGFLMYKTSPTRILSGQRLKGIDSILTASFFLLLLKDLIFYAKSSLQEASSFLKPALIYLISNQMFLITFALYAGLFLIIMMAFRLSIVTTPKKPSVMETITEHICKKRSIFYHTILYSILLFSFFILIFNIIMEWLAIAIDAPLLMISLAAFIIIAIRHHKGTRFSSFLSKFGDFGSSFYTKFMDHLRYKSTMFHSLSGILVLYIIVASLVFLWPFFFSIGDGLYLNILQTQHPWIVNLILQDLADTTMLEGSAILVSYVANIIAILTLSLAPGFIWLLLFRKDRFLVTTIQKERKEVISADLSKIPRPALIIILFSLMISLFTFIFNIQPIMGNALVGVDIFASSMNTQDIFFKLILGCSLSITILLLQYVLRKTELIFRLLIFISTLFFILFVGLFTYSTILYYIITITQLIILSKWILSAAFFIFGIITTIFYISMTSYFLYKVYREFRPHHLFMHKRHYNHPDK